MSFIFLHANVYADEAKKFKVLFCVQKVVNITPVMAHNLFELCCKHFYYTSLWVVTGSTENTLTIPPFPLLQTLSNTIATLEQFYLILLYFPINKIFFSFLNTTTIDNSFTWYNYIKHSLRSTTLFTFIFFPHGLT